MFYILGSDGWASETGKKRNASFLWSSQLGKPVHFRTEALEFFLRNLDVQNKANYCFEWEFNNSILRTVHKIFSYNRQEYVSLIQSGYTVSTLLSFHILHHMEVESSFPSL